MKHNQSQCMTSNSFVNKYLLSDVDFDDIVFINDTQKVSLASIIIDEYNECRLTDDELDMIFTQLNVKENIGNYSITINRLIFSLPQYSEWIVEYEKIKLSKAIDYLLR